MKIMKKISRKRANELAKIKDFRMRKEFTVDELREDGEAFFQNDPPDLISEKSWKYIMNFPDNVAVITSNHCGSALDQIVEFMMFWQTQSNSPSPTHSYLQLAMYNVNGDFKVFAHNLLHGFYRQAVVCLRYSVEAMMQALFLETLKTQENSDLKNLEEKWLFGMLEKKEQEKLKFGTIRSILENQDCFKSIKHIFSHGGMVESLYNSFSKYSHYKHQHESNENHQVISPLYGDPVFDQDYFDICLKLFNQLFLMAFVLRHFIIKDGELQKTYEIFIEKKMDNFVDIENINLILREFK